MVTHRNNLEQSRLAFKKGKYLRWSDTGAAGTRLPTKQTP